MNQKMNRLRTQEMELNVFIARLYKLQRKMIWMVLVSLVIWTSVAIVDIEMGMNLLWVLGINLFLLALIIIMDWELESSMIACAKKRIQLKETILINKNKYGIEENKKYNGDDWRV